MKNYFSSFHCPMRRGLKMFNSISLRFVLVCLSFSCALAKPFAEESSESVQIEPQPRITHLGNVGSKSYFGGDIMTNWQGAFYECATIGMRMATLNSTEEKNFIANQVNQLSKGPFWFGARDIGRKEMFVWSESFGAPGAGSPILFADYYYSVEDGSMALTMNSAYGSVLVGVHSLKIAGKPLCQLTR